VDQAGWRGPWGEPLERKNTRASKLNGEKRGGLVGTGVKLKNYQ